MPPSTVCYMDALGINLFVNTESNEFWLRYLVDNIFTLDSGHAGPFLELEPKYDQFRKILNRFTRIVSRNLEGG